MKIEPTISQGVSENIAVAPRRREPLRAAPAVQAERPISYTKMFFVIFFAFYFSQAAYDLTKTVLATVADGLVIRGFSHQPPPRPESNGLQRDTPDGNPGDPQTLDAEPPPALPQVTIPSGRTAAPPPRQTTPHSDGRPAGR